MNAIDTKINNLKLRVLGVYGYGSEMSVAERRAELEELCKIMFEEGQACQSMIDVIEQTKNNANPEQENVHITIP